MADIDTATAAIKVTVQLTRQPDESDAQWRERARRKLLDMLCRAFDIAPDWIEIDVNGDISLQPREEDLRVVS